MNKEITEISTQKPIKRNVKNGDIIAIPIAQNAVAVGLVLHVSKRIHNGIIVGYFTQLFSSLEDIDIERLENKFIGVPNYTGKQSVYSGRWKVVGNSQDLLVSSEVPTLESAGHLYYKDEEVRPTSHRAIDDYPMLTGAGEMAVENGLREYFSLTHTNE